MCAENDLCCSNNAFPLWNIKTYLGGVYYVEMLHMKFQNIPLASKYFTAVKPSNNWLQSFPLLFKCSFLSVKVPTATTYRLKHMCKEWSTASLLPPPFHSNLLISRIWNVTAVILDFSLPHLKSWHIYWFWGDVESVKCPEEWLPYGGHCFMVHRDPKEWREALISCNESNGDLASIHNPEEHGFILSQLGYSEYFYRTVFGTNRELHC